MDIKPSTKILIKMFIYSMIMSFLVLLFNSKYSFIINGGSFIKNSSVIYNLFSICPFLFEVILFGIYLFLMYRVSRLFLNKYSSSLVVGLNAISICSSNIFEGGSVGEYSLVLISICLYYYLRHFNKKMLTNKDMFICGIITSITLLLDYYLLGIWIGFLLFIILDYVINRGQRRTSIKRLSSYLGGFVIPLVITGVVEYLFFDINGYLNNYFVNRLAFNFNLNTFKEILTDVWGMGVVNYWIVLLSSLLLFKIGDNLYSKFGLLIMLLLMVFVLYINKIGNNNLIILSYFNIGIISIFSFIDDMCKDFIKYYYKGIIVVVSILCILFSIFVSNVI